MKSIAVAALTTGLAFGHEERASKDSARRQREARPEVMTAAAAAGAVIGAAVAKDDRTKGAILGAAVGGLAGLIFDRIMKKKDAERSAPPADTR